MAALGPEKLIKNFRKYEKLILEYIRARIDEYFASRCYTVLKNRVKRLDTSIDMKIGQDKNQWNSKIQIPYGNESYTMTRATLTRNFSPDPLISLEPVYETPWENAIAAQETLAQNYRSTYFRDKAFNQIKKYAARYGSVPVLSYFEHRPQSFKRTKWGDFGFEQAEVSETRQNVWHEAIHPLNYFQDHDVADPDACDLVGWIQRWHISKLRGLVSSENDLYIKDNLKEKLEQIKKGAHEHEHYYTVNPRDTHMWIVDVEHLFTRLNFEGNEDDETTYYVEVLGDKIIRIQDNPNDFDVRTVNILNLDQRNEYWWANTPVEKTFPMENYANITMSILADNIWNASQSMVFYPKGKVDVADLNNRHKNGGFIGVDPAVLREFKVPLWPYQRQELSPAAIQYMMGETKEALQRTQSKPDVKRQGVSGGPRNDTATAYAGMQSEADMLQYDYLSEFAGGLKSLGRTAVIMLQQRLNDRFQIRPNPKEPGKELHKSAIMGEFSYQVETSLTKNTQAELMKYQNALTWVMNMQATGNPAFQRVNIEKLFRAVMKKFDLDVDMDEVYPEQPAGIEAMMQGQGLGPSGIAANVPAAGQSLGQAAPNPAQALPAQGAMA